MSAITPRHTQRGDWVTPAWAVAFLIALVLPFVSPALTVAAVLTTYRDSSRRTKALILLAGLLVLVVQLVIAFLPPTMDLDVGPRRLVSGR